jgi:hypothetical protein
MVVVPLLYWELRRRQVADPLPAPIEPTFVTEEAGA